MSRQSATSQDARGASAAGSASVAAARHSAELVRHLLDRAAYFNFFSLPDARHDADAGTCIRNAGAVTGFRISERLHRFEVVMHPPSSPKGLSASNSIGERLGRFDSRWMLCPDDFEATPDREPPPTPLDPTRRQRFVMLDAECALDGGADGFRGFGAGMTFPMAGGELLAGAVGNVMLGRGRFRGLEGTYVYCGSLSESEGFRGSLMLRVMDPQGAFEAEGAPPALDASRWPAPGVTYLMFLGQARETDKAVPVVGAGGQIEGMNVAQQLRLFQTDAAARGRGRLRGKSHVGHVIGEIDARIDYDPAGAGGGALDPIPYTALNEYKFTGRDGQTVGSLFIDESEGRTFHLQLAGAPGQSAIRFGGFGPVLRGTGSLEGAEGLMTDNSVVSFTPHVSASVYVIHMNDPGGRYRAGVGAHES